MKKSVYFIQANPVYGEDDKTVYIPYAIGCIAAFAWADERISSHFRLGKFIYTREPVGSVVAALDSPFLIAFSCSVWNMEYNKALAKSLKNTYPNCLIVFGGHHVSPDAADLKDYAFIDILVHGTGEETFRDLLLALDDNRSLDTVANLSFRMENGTTKTTEKQLSHTPDYPSPYLEGYFDDILRDGIRFSAILETNRGCPNKCAFCDWGELQKKVVLFPYEKIEKELDWVAAHGIEYVYCADANFGLFERDDRITDRIVQLKTKVGFPQRFRVNIAKNITDTVKRIVQKFHENNLDKSLPLSYQSLSPTVLRNIGRRNMDLNHFKALMALYNRIGVSTSSELILGLPGETYESFCEGICTLLECGQHKSINVYACELLPNSQMGSAGFREQHRIESVRVPFYQIHCKIPGIAEDIQEYSEFVVSTATMPREDWVNSAVFSFFILALHNLGLTRALALYLRHEVGISYLRFYTDLLRYFENAPNTLMYAVINSTRAMTRGVLDGSNAWVCENKKFGELTWGFEELAFLELVSASSRFYREINDFLNTYALEPGLQSALVLYQEHIIKLPVALTQPIHSEYNFSIFFDGIFNGNPTALKKQRNDLVIKDDTAFDSWADYAREIVWLGRRDDAAVYTGGRYNVSLLTP